MIILIKVANFLHDKTFFAKVKNDTIWWNNVAILATHAGRSLKAQEADLAKAKNLSKFKKLYTLIGMS
jgi:hypothetical protein